MPGINLHWTILNLNGKIIQNKPDATLRCQWKGAG
jgi:hypothetical protein